MVEATDISIEVYMLLLVPKAMLSSLLRPCISSLFIAAGELTAPSVASVDSANSVLDPY
jgi:hypothetical protein